MSDTPRTEREEELEHALKRLLAGAVENPNGMGPGLSTFHIAPLSQHLYMKYRAIADNSVWRTDQTANKEATDA